MFAAALVCLSSGAKAYYNPVPGYSESSYSVPLPAYGYIGGMDILPTGGNWPDVVYGEGGNLSVVRGGTTSMLRSASGYVAQGFVLGEPVGDRVLFADTSDYTSYNIYEINADGSGEVYRGVVDYVYDAAVNAAGEVFFSVSASYIGPSYIVRFDRTTGQTQRIAEFNGNTGPLTFDGDGNLYYGTAAAFINPDQNIYKITAQQLQNALVNGVTLQQNSLAVAAANIYAPSDLLALPGGSLLFSTNVSGGGGLWKTSGNGASLFATLSDSSLYQTNLAFSEGTIFVNIGGVGPYSAPTGVIVQLVPEPSALFDLAGLGVAGLFGFRRRLTRAPQITARHFSV